MLHTELVYLSSWRCS